MLCFTIVVSSTVGRGWEYCWTNIDHGKCYQGAFFIGNNIVLCSENFNEIKKGTGNMTSFLLYQFRNEILLLLVNIMIKFCIQRIIITKFTLSRIHSKLNNYCCCCYPLMSLERSPNWPAVYADNYVHSCVSITIVTNCFKIFYKFWSIIKKKCFFSSK